MRTAKVIFFLIPILLILLFYGNLIFHIGTHLMDWRDYPFVVWILQNNMKHIVTLDLGHLYDTSAMYPFRYSLSFTDHMFFPSLVALALSLISKNPLLQFNIITVLNHILVYVSFFILTSRFSRSTGVRVAVSFFAAFSPYMLSQMGHLQMLMVWPLYISLYFLMEPQRRVKHLLLCGIFLGITFHSSVYLGLMGLFAVFAHEAVRAILNQKYLSSVKEFIFFLLVFLVIISPSLYGYLELQAMYHPDRGQEEFVSYSAHITDYALIAPNNSIFDTFAFNKTVGRLNRHVSGEMAAFIGFVPLAAILYWLLKNRKNIGHKKTKTTIAWLAVLVVCGVVFSLGPRANFNGRYLVFPLPYYLVLKLFPPIGILRAVARWYFIYALAINILFVYAANYISGLLKKNRFQAVFTVVLFALLVLEFYPPPANVSSQEWKTPSYLYLQQACKSKPGAVLIYPFEYRYKFKDVGKYLSLKTNQLMSSTLYDCPTLSGFSSFEPPLFKEWQTDFDTNGITDSNMTILKDNKFAYVMINLEALSIEEKTNPQSVIHTKALKEVFRDKGSIIYKIIY